MKNKKIILIISIVLVILIIGILSIGILYFTTDAFKSNKQLFFKYSSKMINTKVEDQMTNYFEKKKNVSYKNSGKITLNNSSTDDDYSDMIKKANDMNITFEGAIDNANKMAKEEMRLNYSDDVYFPVTYGRDRDIYGLQSEYVSKKYIALENDNLKELCEKIGITDTDNIPDKIEIEKSESKMKLTEDEKTKLKERYQPILDKNLKNDQFTKSTNGDQIAYTLEITKDQMKDIVKQALETLKTDEILLPKINEILKDENKNINGNDIDKFISELEDKKENELENNSNNVQQDNEKIKITVYQKNREFSKLEVKIGDEIQIELHATEEKDSFKLEANLISKTRTSDTFSSNSGTDLENLELYAKIEYTGLETLNNVKEQYTIGMKTSSNDNEMNYEYSYENNIEFTSDINIDKLTEENSFILNEQEAETISNFIMALGERITEVNTEQMQELGVNENLILYTNPYTIELMQITKAFGQTSDSFSDELGEIEKEMFNEKFSKYSGTIKGSAVRALIREVEEYESYDAERNVQINVDETSINNISNYTVNLVYDDDGYISEIIVEEE